MTAENQTVAGDNDRRQELRGIACAQLGEILIRIDSLSSTELQSLVDELEVRIDGYRKAVAS